MGKSARKGNFYFIEINSMLWYFMPVIVAFSMIPLLVDLTSPPKYIITVFVILELLSYVIISIVIDEKFKRMKK